MIEKIYIPTLGRAGKQITWDCMPDFIKDITVLVVQPHEKDFYGLKPIMVLPEDNMGITRTRRWIWEKAGKIKYGMFDDDLKFMVRTPKGKKSKKPLSDNDWKTLMTVVDSWLDEVSFSGFRQGNMPPWELPFTDNRSVTCAYFFNGNDLPLSHNLDWSLEFCEDIHLVLQLLEKLYSNRIWDKYVYISDQMADGGCNTTRTLEAVNANHQKLIEFHPNYVDWNGLSDTKLGKGFKKIKVSWMKSYSDNIAANIRKWRQAYDE